MLHMKTFIHTTFRLSCELANKMIEEGRLETVALDNPYHKLHLTPHLPNKALEVCDDSIVFDCIVFEGLNGCYYRAVGGSRWYPESMRDSSHQPFTGDAVTFVPVFPAHCFRTDLAPRSLLKYENYHVDVVPMDTIVWVEAAESPEKPEKDEGPKTLTLTETDLMTVLDKGVVYADVGDGAPHKLIIVYEARLDIPRPVLCSSNAPISLKITVYDHTVKGTYQTYDYMLFDRQSKRLITKGKSEVLLKRVHSLLEVRQAWR